ncbi:hypothetical protein TI05_18125, partial [Achromatium sp. WMS3]
CMSTGGRGSQTQGLGFQVLNTDPNVESAGVDTGFAPVPEMLRAPDVAVGNVPNTPGWVQAVPPLALEYADTGQNEKELTDKIKELLQHGTKHIWVVRLNGPRLVEVHEPGKPMYRVFPGEELTAPGILRNPVTVESLYDREAAQAATLRHLLQRHGYESIEDIHAQGEVAGETKGEATILKHLIKQRFGSLPQWAELQIDSAQNTQLEYWAGKIFTATSIEELLTI